MFSVFPQRSLLTVSETHRMQSTSLPLLPSYLQIASSVTEGSGLFVGILLLLLIPFKPFPTQFPEQYSSAQSPLVASHHTGKKIYALDLEVTCSPTSAGVSDLVFFMLSAAHQPHEPSFCSLRRPSSFPGASSVITVALPV